MNYSDNGRTRMYINDSDYIHNEDENIDEYELFPCSCKSCICHDKTIDGGQCMNCMSGGHQG